MYILLNIIVLLFILFIGYIINYIFKKDYKALEGYTIGIITCIILYYLLNNKKIKIKNKKLLNIFILILATFGGFLWFFGEILVYTNIDDNPLIDPIGAFLVFLSAFISFLLYIN
jgi:hypothetical protein